MKIINECDVTLGDAINKMKALQTILNFFYRFDYFLKKLLLSNFFCILNFTIRVFSSTKCTKSFQSEKALYYIPFYLFRVHMLVSHLQYSQLLLLVPAKSKFSNHSLSIYLPLIYIEILVLYKMRDRNIQDTILCGFFIKMLFVVHQIFYSAQSFSHLQFLLCHLVHFVFNQNQIFTHSIQFVVLKMTAAHRIHKC